ncbi:MAG: PDZ domain-containing protein [Propionibacteriaceae bacterium]|nr:PDZ domain-containing protein [Propionibacteriaceae bacterium]
MTQNTKTALVALVIFVAMVSTLAVAPVGFVAWDPGQTVDLLAEGPDGPAVEVAGAPTYAAGGHLMLATVTQTAADTALRFPEAVFRHLLPDHDVRPWSRVYDPGATNALVVEQDRAAMATSQEAAAVAALRAAGLPVAEFARVTDVPATAPAAGRLRAGDVVLTVNGVSVATPAEAIAEVRRNAVGGLAQITLRRPGAQAVVQEDVRLGPLANEPEVPTLGVTWGQGYEHAADVAFRIDPAIGGNSAGLALGLAVYDRLTPGSLTGGDQVAAAGVLDLIEPADYRIAEVRRVQAIREKLAAARERGATVFLMPGGNCADLGPEAGPDGLRVIPVASFHAAVEILTDLAAKGDAARVPRC